MSITRSRRYAISTYPVLDLKWFMDMFRRTSDKNILAMYENLSDEQQHLVGHCFRLWLGYTHTQEIEDREKEDYKGIELLEEIRNPTFREDKK